VDFETVWKKARIANPKSGYTNSIDIIEDGAIGISEGKIEWLGSTDNLPSARMGHHTVVHDCNGSLLTPGLIDCHTHLVFGGDRSSEFQLRLEGKTYEEIARSGGGIISTMDATRSTSSKELEEKTCQRAFALIRQGVTTIEVKSGYGMDVAHEMRLLEVIDKISHKLPVRVMRTLLGLHALPPEYGQNRDLFVTEVCEELLPNAVSRNLVDMVDAFCESIAFTTEECSRFFKKAKDLGVPIRLHADQLSDTGGATLAAGFAALSADHLEYISEEGVIAMAQAATVAVLLPGAFYYLKEEQVPPIPLFRKHGVPFALATDANPGSSPVFSILSAMNMGCLHFGLTPEEAFVGVTKNAACALGLDDQIGTLQVGKLADFAIWDLEHPRELAYWIGLNPCKEVVVGGKRITLTIPESF